MRLSTISTVLCLFAAPLAIIAAPAPAPEAIAEAEPEAHHGHFPFGNGPGVSGRPDFSGSFGPRPTDFPAAFGDMAQNGGRPQGSNPFNSAAFPNSWGPPNSFVQNTQGASNFAQNTGEPNTVVAQNTGGASVATTATAAAAAPVTTS
ncbi:MAG: hypothetical protein Q9225_004529 [Loekoesia sp. 1 TL-2023]